MSYKQAKGVQPRQNREICRCREPQLRLQDTAAHFGPSKPIILAGECSAGVVLAVVQSSLGFQGDWELDEPQPIHSTYPSAFGGLSKSKRSRPNSFSSSVKKEAVSMLLGRTKELSTPQAKVLQNY